MEISVTTVGLDLVKSSFHVFCADENGHCVERKLLRRKQVLEYFGRLAPCTVAMETCSGANWWCRKLRELGHDARLIPAAYVKPYGRGQKNNDLDAEAICEAAQRPTMRFAPLKSEVTSSVLAAHRSRRQLMKQPTMNRNHIRSACAEFGMVGATPSSPLSHSPRACSFPSLEFHVPNESDMLPHPPARNLESNRIQQ